MPAPKTADCPFQGRSASLENHLNYGKRTFSRRSFCPPSGFALCSFLRIAARQVTALGDSGLFSNTSGALIGIPVLLASIPCFCL